MTQTNNEKLLQSFYIIPLFLSELIPKIILKNSYYPQMPHIFTVNQFI